MLLGNYHFQYLLCTNKLPDDRRGIYHRWERNLNISQKSTFWDKKHKMFIKGSTFTRKSSVKTISTLFGTIFILSAVANITNTQMHNKSFSDRLTNNTAQIATAVASIKNTILIDVAHTRIQQLTLTEQLEQY